MIVRAVPRWLVLCCLPLAASACGDGDRRGSAAREATAPDAAGQDGREPSDENRDAGPGGSQKGAKITLGKSEFGQMLFDSNKQAIYIFENDPQGRSVCYGACAEAWPPVVTKGEPRAGDGVEPGLLGTLERRDGSLQLTYAGKPLYFYAHEAPGEVRCHNVNLNGGYWWVIGPNGRRLP